MSKQKTVLVVDDHPLFRAGLKSIITNCSEFEIIGEAANGREGIEKAKELKPNMVVMDLSLPDPC